MASVRWSRKNSKRYGRDALVAGAIIVACHSVSETEHQRGGAGASAGAGGTTTAASGSAGAEPEANGGAGAAAGATGAAGEPSVGGAAGAAGCSAGGACVVDPCGPQPGNNTPAPYRTPCGEGLVCTGDGSCVKDGPSCPDATNPCSSITVPGGSVDMIQDGGGSYLQTVQVSAFAIEKWEVTVGRFKAFWDAGHQAPSASVPYPGGHVITDIGPVAAIEPGRMEADPSFNWSPDTVTMRMPLNGLPWSTALAFCVWDGARLPTEAEWELAARGREGTGLELGAKYPWGDEAPQCFDANLNFCVDPAASVDIGNGTLVGGLVFMVGNVSEWTADLFQNAGGSCWPGGAGTLLNPLCVNDAGYGHTAKGRSCADAGWDSDNREGITGAPATVGVRCVRDIVPPS